MTKAALILLLAVTGTAVHIHNTNKNGRKAQGDPIKDLTDQINRNPQVVWGAAKGALDDPIGAAQAVAGAASSPVGQQTIQNGINSNPVLSAASRLGEAFFPGGKPAQVVFDAPAPGPTKYSDKWAPNPEHGGQWERVPLPTEAPKMGLDAAAEMMDASKWKLVPADEVEPPKVQKKADSDPVSGLTDAIGGAFQKLGAQLFPAPAPAHTGKWEPNPKTGMWEEVVVTKPPATLGQVMTDMAVATGQEKPQLPNEKQIKEQLEAQQKQFALPDPAAAPPAPAATDATQVGDFNKAMEGMLGGFGQPTAPAAPAAPAGDAAPMGDFNKAMEGMLGGFGQPTEPAAPAAPAAPAGTDQQAAAANPQQAR